MGLLSESGGSLLTEAGTGVLLLESGTLGPLDLKESLIATLAVTGAVTDLIADRVYPKAIPQTATLPALSYEFVSAVRDTVLTGVAGMKRVRVRIVVRSHLEADTEAAGVAMRRRFQGIPAPLGRLVICYCWLENEFDSSTAPVDGSDLWTYEKSLDFVFKLRESAVNS